MFRGLAPDGGLFVPEPLPALRWPPPLSTATLVDEAGVDDLRPLSRWAAQALFPGVPGSVLSRVVDRALDFPVPLHEIEPRTWVLELFHGPTHAFKDVGARFMARLMSELDPDRTSKRAVLVATSGDTGGAVATAYHGMERYDVVALFPREGVSERQRRQMTTLGGNVHAVAVDGTFDDCQRMVKTAFRDRALADRHRLTSANSINVARLLPQSLYYLHAAFLLERRASSSGPTVVPSREGVGASHAPPGLERRAHFVVPAGNLGNLCAGLLAGRAGMPAAGFTAATNENRGFADYLDGADFEPRPVVSTTSSAMDVGDPSNLERILWLYGGDDDAVRRAVQGVVVAQDDVFRCIAELHDRTGYVADPHTAVAYAAATGQNARADAPMVVLATAHPAKFPETVEAAIGREVPLPPGLAATQEREERMRSIEATAAALTGVLEELHG